MSSLACVLLVVLVTQAEDDGLAAEAKLRSSRLAYVKEAAAAYDFAGGDRPIELHPQPLLRWQNHVVQEQDALLFLWTQAGRPVAAAQFFCQETCWIHEFQSLTFPGPDREFIATAQGGSAWAPKVAGQFVAPTPDVIPATTAVQRLHQMKKIAESFTASDDIVVDVDAGRIEKYILRLLPTPIYRYPRQSEVIDGAIFVLAQDNNPEILITIECLEQNPQQYQVGLTRMTSYALQVTQNGQDIWSCEPERVPTSNLAGGYWFRFLDRDRRLEEQPE